MKRTIDVVYLVTSFVGAAVIAANINANVIGYVLFFISSVTGGYLAAKSDASRSLLIVNIAFAAINLIGIWRYWS